MKIAIVTDTVPVPLWSEDWKKLCIANKIEYREFDSYEPNFLDELLAYLPYRVLWRSGNSPPKKFKDEAQRQLLDKAGLRVVPNWQTHYVYDHKIRQSYLWKLHGIPHPETRIFFREPDALEYLRKVKYPFVIKADSGAGAKSFRFVEDELTALEIIRNTFHKKGKWAGREYESKILYVQEYIPILGSWRVGVFRGEVAYGYFARVKGDTRKASGQNTQEYIPLPAEALKLAASVIERLNWDYGFFDILWSEKHGRFLVLEVCDTCGTANQKRGLTYYKEEAEWISRKENTSVQEIIFRLFVLESAAKIPEAPGC